MPGHETRAAWLIRHARADADAGRPLPPDFPAMLRDALSNPPETVSDLRPAPPIAATIETRKKYRQVAEVAQEVGTPTWTLRRLARAGHIRAWQAGPGCTWWIDPESVQDYLTRRDTWTDPKASATP